MLDFKDLKHIHLIGIGGIGVSAIAEVLNSDGYKVTGSDIKTSELTRSLERKGIGVNYTHDSDNIIGADVVVYTAAVNESNPELKAAREQGLLTLTRAEMLGEILSLYKHSIAIAGAHGKTTTTSFLSIILNESDLDPTLLIGGEVKEFASNVKTGKGDLIVTEACEYKDSFLSFKPTIGVILNIDEDHLDYFRDLEHIISSFTKFAKSIPKSGHLVINNDDYNAKKIISHVDCNLLSFGISQESDVQAKNITYDPDGLPEFEVYIKDELYSTFKLSVPGNHNIYNSLAAIAVAYLSGLNGDDVAKSTKIFAGTKRRFDRLGKFKNATVVDDYAHHPTEIKATLSAAKKVPHNKSICVFQPHTYTRTAELLGEFATSFKQADVVIITDIYGSARETDNGRVHSRDLVEAIKNEGQMATYLGTFDEVILHLNEIVEREDLIFTMGAGNIIDLGKKLADIL